MRTISGAIFITLVTFLLAWIGIKVEIIFDKGYGILVMIILLFSGFLMISGLHKRD